MSPELSLLVPVLVGHWVGDFVLQTDWQAKNKSKDNRALGSHVASYTATLMVTATLLSLFVGGWLVWTLWALLNGVLHLGVDYVTSRINSRLWAAERVHDFFVSVGFDQLVHTLTLIVTLSWLIF